MNIQSNFEKIYTKIKHGQIDESDLTPENFGEAAFRAGQLDMAKFLIKLYEGQLSDEEFNIELALLEPVEAVN